MALESVKLITLFFFSFSEESVLVIRFWEAHEYLIPGISSQPLKPQWEYTLVVENPSDRDGPYLSRLPQSSLSQMILSST